MIGPASLRRLAAEVRADRAAMEARTEDVSSYSADDTPPRPEFDAALALALDHTYSALESALERVARNLEDELPKGSDWHRALLDAAGLDIPRVRPAILSQPSLTAAHELRRFRHFLRHAYAVALDRTKLCRVAVDWLEAVDRVGADLAQFDGFLLELADSLER